MSAVIPDRNRTVLLLAHAFPPSAVVGALRPAKFVKYLPHHGWKPVVVTSDQRAYPSGDDTLLRDVEGAEVLVTRSCETGPTLERLQRVRARGRFAPVRFLARSAAYVLDGVVAPDHAVGWVPWAASAAVKCTRGRDVSVILATGGPFATLLAGLWTKRLTGVPLVVDYRDPWTLAPSFAPRPLRRVISQRMEAAVVRAADAVVVVNDQMKQALVSQFGDEIGWRTHVIPNGYDLDEIPSRSRSRGDGRLRIVHVGLFNARRTPESLWDFLAGLDPELAESIDVRLVGAGDGLAIPPDFQSFVSTTPRLPRRQAMQEMVDADVLLILTGDYEDTNTKVFEYLATRLPIMLIGNPEAAAADLLRDVGAGVSVAATAPEAAIDMLWECLRFPGASRYAGYAPPSRYSRVHLAGQMAEILNGLAGGGRPHE